MIAINRSSILTWLQEDDPFRLEELWREADRVRQAGVGDEVFFRGLVEISNHCRRNCTYCGIRAGRTGLPRYRLTQDEILECARQSAAFGYGTVVLQAGEDPELTADFIGRVTARIRQETGQAVTLSLGERTDGELRAFRQAGANRYLLRFETSDPALFRRIHPPLAGAGRNRIEMLHRLRALGFETGSGIMVGIPGQSWTSLAEDILLFARLDLDMIGIGPYLPHPDTPLGRRAAKNAAIRTPEQVPATPLMTCKAVALARLACPLANIPATSALESLDPEHGRESGLRRGANIIMPDLTPPACRPLYSIYPGKAGLAEDLEQTGARLQAMVQKLGRRIGTGPGASPNWCRRTGVTPG